MNIKGNIKDDSFQIDVCCAVNYARIGMERVMTGLEKLLEPRVREGSSCKKILIDSKPDPTFLMSFYP